MISLLSSVTSPILSSVAIGVLLQTTILPQVSRNLVSYLET
jgi:hypothetical protein